jgi:hypothetical protein
MKEKDKFSSQVTISGTISQVSNSVAELEAQMEPLARVSSQTTETSDVL